MSQKNSLNSEFLLYTMTTNVAYGKKIFDKLGYFDEKLISGEDADFARQMQLETDYKIVYDQNAIVIHKHKTNLKALFKQQFNYGYGCVLLYKKHNYFMRFNVKQTLFAFLCISGYRLGRVIWIGKTGKIICLNFKLDYI